MFGSLGFPEILFILVVALLVFGPKRLPEIGRTIGKALGEFRQATGDLKRSLDREITMDSPSTPRPASTTTEVSESGDATETVEPESEKPAESEGTDRAE